MAELAIPLVALGGLYVISNHDKDKDNEVKEGFQNEGVNRNMGPLPGVKPPMPPVNYPKNTPIKNTNPRYYPDANQTTDKYFRQDVFQRIEQNNPRESNGGGTQQSLGLNGAPINKADFKHNNMVPFFGARVKGSTTGHDGAQSRLDNMQGAGSQYIRKTEQAPLFKPQANMTWANGMPNTTEFMLSRQMPSTKMNNIKPWDEERVAPGLGQGYTTTGSGSGYNAAMEDRKAWLPKTVNELRVETNPKVTFGLDGHQGPAVSRIKQAGNTQTQGRVEKNRPDTDYTVGPSRWFTTTGVEKAQTYRSKVELQDVNRPDYSETNYFGDGADAGRATYVNTYENKTHKQQLDGPGIAAPTAKGPANKADYGNGSYTNVCNNRSSTRQPEEMGPLQGLVSAITAPILDVLRPTRKENVIGNARINGNATAPVFNGQVYNPGDRLRTTIKEQTVEGTGHLYYQNQGADGYKVANPRAGSQHRDTTCAQFTGNAEAVNSAAMSQVSNYNQRNINKSAPGRTNQGGTDSFNGDINMTLRNDALRQNNRANAPASTTSAIPSAQTFGDVNMPQYYNECQGCDRIDPNILTAFKNNPYTQSLNSWA